MSRCWVPAAAAAAAAAALLLVLAAAGAQAEDSVAPTVPLGFEAPPAVDSASAAQLTDELARFLEVTGKNEAALHPQQAGHGHHGRHRHRRHSHDAGDEMRFRSVGGASSGHRHLSEDELDKRASEYAKWAAQYWAPRTYYEHYYSHPGFDGKFYPQAGAPAASQKEENGPAAPPRFAERRAPAAQGSPSASLMDALASMGGAHAQATPLAYSGPMAGSAAGPAAGAGAPSFVEAGTQAQAAEGHEMPSYGMSQDSPVAGAYGPPMQNAPGGPMNLNAIFGGQGGDQTMGNNAPQPGAFGGAQMPAQQPVMMQQAPMQMQQQQAPMQQMQQQQMNPMFAQQFAFRQQFGQQFGQQMMQQQQQQMQQAAQLPAASGAPVQFYSPTAYPPPAPNQVPFSSAQVAASYPAQMQAPTTAEMRFAAAGSTAPPPLNTNMQPMNPNAPRFQNEQASSYPFGLAAGGRGGDRGPGRHRPPRGVHHGPAPVPPLGPRAAAGAAHGEVPRGAPVRAADPPALSARLLPAPRKRRPRVEGPPAAPAAPGGGGGGGGDSSRRGVRG